MLLRLNSLCSVFRGKPPSDSPRGPSRDFILSFSTISSPSSFYIDPRIWVTRKKYAPGEFFLLFPRARARLVRGTKERTSTPEWWDTVPQTIRHNRPSLLYQLSIRPRAHYPSFLIRGATWNLGAVRVARPKALLQVSTFSSTRCEEISLARGEFVRSSGHRAKFRNNGRSI